MLSLSANRIQASASSCRFKHRFTLVEAAHKCRLITKRAEYKAAKKHWGWGDVPLFLLKNKTLCPATASPKHHSEHNAMWFSAQLRRAV